MKHLHPRLRARSVPATLAFLLLLAISSRAEGPLNTADVVRFLGVGISENAVLVEVRTRGFAAMRRNVGETFLARSEPARGGSDRYLDRGPAGSRFGDEASCTHRYDRRGPRRPRPSP